MADIVLKDRNGSPVQYPGVERIKVNTVDGEAVEFVDSAVIPEVLENLPIALDFSGGNQTVTAPDGMVVKSAIIQHPANLIPENIAEGVNIAGIVGAFKGGGAKVATGTIATEQTSSTTITHDLGVIPDLILVVPTYMQGMGANYIRFLCGASETLRKIVEIPMVRVVTNSSGLASYLTYSAPITGTNIIGGATTTTFTIKAGTNAILAEGVPWIAIAGLT